MADHVKLRVHGTNVVEPVHVERLGADRYRVLFSPGLVEGIAAGDEIETLGADGVFRVLHRSGNLAVQVISEGPVQDLRAPLEELVVRKLGGRLDGAVQRGFVFTIPLAAGFEAVASVFDSFVAERTGVVWMYGNVYSSETGEPLNWWLT